MVQQYYFCIPYYCTHQYDQSTRNENKPWRCQHETTPPHSVFAFLLLSRENSYHIVFTTSCCLTPSRNQVTDIDSSLIRHHFHTFHVVFTTSCYYVLTSHTCMLYVLSSDESCQLTLLPNDRTKNNVIPETYIYMIPPRYTGTYRP